MDRLLCAMGVSHGLQFRKKGLLHYPKLKKLHIGKGMHVPIAMGPAIPTILKKRHVLVFK